MITHPPAWDTLATKGAAIRPAVLVQAYTFAGTVIDVPVTDGWILKDAGQYPRSHVQIQVADTSLLPTSLNSALQPAGGFLRIDMGYTDTNGTTSYIRVHDGPITKVSSSRPGSIITVESADYSVYATGYIRATDASYPGPTNTLAGIPASVLGTSLRWWYLNPDYSGLSGAQLTQAAPTDLVQPAGTSDWAFIEQCMDMLGAEAWISPTRQLIVRAVPTVGSPVYTFTVGESGTLTDYRSEIQRPTNYVMLKYDNGIVGSWSDNTTTSPTYILGFYGSNALYEKRSGTPTQAQADAAAKEYARRDRGNGRSFTMRAVPVPWLEPGDTVAVAAIGETTENHVIQSITIPLGLDAMTVTTRNPVYSSVM